MIVSHDALTAAISRGDIVVDPLLPSLIGVNSIDIRLGMDMWEFRHPKDGPRDLYGEPTTEWRKVIPITAGAYRANSAYMAKNWALGVVPDDAHILLLRSGGFYLGTTLERIGTRRRGDGNIEYVPDMRAKSTFGRHGLTVALCAGLGDVGYCSRWALEIRVADPVNVKHANPVPLAVGTPIGQCVFHEVTPSSVEYGGASNYQPVGGTETPRFLPKQLQFLDPTRQP